MSLFVDLTPGVDLSNATLDLFTISWNDGNVGQGPSTTITGGMNGITSISAAPITYAGGVTTGMATANRLFELATTNSGQNWANPILITALPGGNDPYLGIDVTGNGFAYVDTTVTPNVIHVCYDTSNNNGQGLVVYAANGDAIQIPNAVLLYHELSHAFHRAIDQHPFPQSACPSVTGDEPAAEIDENVMRAQLGLCLRDVCNHAGATGWGKACGGRATVDGPPLVDGTAPPIIDDPCCFVVTAATGTPFADEIVRLRVLRDQLAARSRLAGELIAAIYDEYAGFSPQIAARIALDPIARSLVREVVVAPLLAWYEYAEQLSREASDTLAVERCGAVLAAACRPELAALIVPALQQAKTGKVGPGIAAFAPDLAKVVELPFAAWAVLEPLTSAWTQSATLADLHEAVSDWLSGAPLDRLTCTASADPATTDMDHELAVLASLFDFAPAKRRVLGSRLAFAWPLHLLLLQRHDLVG